MGGVVALGFLLLAVVVPLCGQAAAGSAQSAPLEVAQGDEPAARELEPRYEPAPLPEKSWYNDSYLFAATRAVDDSALQPWAKVALFTLSVPFDLVLLPLAAIGGMFG